MLKMGRILVVHLPFVGDLKEYRLPLLGKFILLTLVVSIWQAMLTFNITKGDIHDFE